ncbi:glycosyltransferase [Conexibacter sp. DBS9H8]|uniref:glycosyltransferase n=1 Tax=Conexibacter sp. DBS9H8 TaxID=2937801 RepID=UPI00200C3D22|nr:glycosyltransferase [Conexibacter sp. DBS9H8]
MRGDVSDSPAIDVTRGDVVVLIPVYGGHDLFSACLGSVLAHTPAQVPILVADDASPDGRPAALVETLAAAQPERRLHLLRQPVNVGFPANVNAGLAACAPADVIVLNSDCEIGAGWLERLTDAARSEATVATVTALTNHGTIVSVPGRVPGPLPAGWTAAGAADAVAAASLRLRPRLPTAVGHCVYLRRSAIELVGDFDLAFSPGYGEEVDFSQRCLQAGLCHLLADDVFVHHHGGASFSATGTRSETQLAHEAIVAARYPYYPATVAAVESERGQLARAVGIARRALTGIDVLVDVRVLAGATTGTQIHAVELLGALTRTAGLRLSVLIPDQLSPYGADALARLPQVARLTRAEAEARADRFDLVHRPFQVNDFDDLMLLSRLADRLVVTQQDLIGFHNPSYFPDHAGWRGYREITRAALASADCVLFFSHHARGEALGENLVEPSRTRVVPIGVDHVLSSAAPTPVPPRGSERLGADGPAIICLGTDFRHKNRLFALRVLAALRERHDFRGQLVLAGPSVPHGSSRGQEAELLSTRPGLANAVVEFGALSEEEKAWLYERAALVLYPTVQEGFGLVPFEAADHDRPCLWAAGTSLAEVIPGVDGGIVAWDPVATAERAHVLLSDADRRTAHIADVRAAAAGLGWDATAAGLLEAYQATVDGPPVPGLAASGSRVGPGAIELTEDAIHLLGPGGALPTEMHRPLLALATHRSVSTPVFSAVRFAYRLAYALNRRRG